MKIAICILVLTFVVYLDIVRCSSSVPGPSNIAPFTLFQWDNVETHGHQVRVKKNPLTKKLIAIELQGQQHPPKAYPGRIRRIIDYAKNLDFVAEINPHTGEWIAVAPLPAEYETILPRLHEIQPRNRP